VGGRREPGFRHADDRDTELLVDVCPEPGPARRIQVDVAVDDEQADVINPGEDRAQRREFALVERAGPVGGHVFDENRLLVGDR
jgi:hypothetical protein